MANLTWAQIAAFGDVELEDHINPKGFKSTPSKILSDIMEG